MIEPHVELQGYTRGLSMQLYSPVHEREVIRADCRRELGGIHATIDPHPRRVGEELAVSVTVMTRTLI